MRRAQNCVRTTLGLVVASLTVFLLPTSAAAGIGGGAVMTWPTTAAVGEIFTASVLIVNLSTAPENTENVLLLTLFVTPACASGLYTPECTATPINNLDPGVFKIL